MFLKVASVSSTVSWSNAAAKVLGPAPKFARIIATATGWVIYGSPDLLNCPWCLSRA